MRFEVGEYVCPSVYRFLCKSVSRKVHFPLDGGRGHKSLIWKNCCLKSTKRKFSVGVNEIVLTVPQSHFFFLSQSTSTFLYYSSSLPRSTTIASCNHRYKPLVVETMEERILESPHPHDRAADEVFPLEFPGAESIQVYGIVLSRQFAGSWGAVIGTNEIG